MAQYTILSTKKIEPALKTGLAENGIELLEQEFIAIKELYNKEKHEEVFPWVIKEEAIAVVFTSRHAVACVTKHLHADDTFYIPDQWQIFCLSGATQEEVLKRHDEKQIAGTATNAADLANCIITNGSFKEVVFFCGNKRRDELPDLLTANGIIVHEVIVYETIETPKVATGRLDAVLFFSPSAVKSFFSVNQLQPGIACFAIGDTTANAIGQYTANSVITSEQPSQEMMLASVTFYLQNMDLYK
jgi:uroporphyrinogen-III synthase